MSNGFSKLPLQKKVSLALLLTIMAFAVFSYLILSAVISPAFDDLEHESARTDLVRAEQSLHNDLDNLTAIAGDWALWDDMYHYVLGRNPAFSASNLERPTLTNLNLDLMIVYAADGRLLWGDLLVEGDDRELGDLGILGRDDAESRLIVSHEKTDALTTGIAHTRIAPMLIVSRPILKSDDSGPIAGALVMGQFLNDARLQRFRERTEVDMFWTAIDDPASFAIDRGAGIGVADTNFDVQERVVSSSKILHDILGAPVLVIGANTPRRISMLGDRTLNVAMAFLLLAGLLVTVVMWVLLRRTMLKPIGLLAAHIDNIRKSGDLSQSLHLNSEDEVGALAKQFNSLTSEVHEARKALLFQSFKAGKADTAAEVLHNIRNAMTPLINGVERLAKAFRVADSLRVPDAIDELSDPNCPPERAAKFRDYIAASFAHIRASNAEAADDLRIVMSQARQVEAIMHDQEKFANVPPASENIAIDEVVGEAAHVIPREAQGEVDVEIDAGLHGYRVFAHRIGLLQVLGNLILNAYESIQRASRPNGRIYLSACKDMVDNQQMIRLTVSDNGTGFAEDMKNRVFQRGFTSKGVGDTTGLGLHWCANAVAGMGGKISAESDGADQGAHFHVLLPVAEGGV